MSSLVIYTYSHKINLWSFAFTNFIGSGFVFIYNQCWFNLTRVYIWTLFPLSIGDINLHDIGKGSRNDSPGLIEPVHFSVGLVMSLLNYTYCVALIVLKPYSRKSFKLWLANKQAIISNFRKLKMIGPELQGQQ